MLRRQAIAPAQKRSQNTTWKDFISAHVAVLAGMDFFTAEVLAGEGQMWRVTGSSPDAATGLGRNEVRVSETQLTQTPRTLTVAPISVEIYEFARK